MLGGSWFAPASHLCHTLLAYACQQGPAHTLACTHAHTVAPLQAPFCVHPKTGKVCVPLDVASIWEFDPDAVPSLGQLLEEVQSADGGGKVAKVRGPRGGWGGWGPLRRKGLQQPACKGAHAVAMQPWR